MTDRSERFRSPTDPDTALADALLAWLRGDVSGLEVLSPDDRAAADDLRPWLELLAEHGPEINDRGNLLAVTVAGANPAGALEDDPIAVALGLVADPDRRLAAQELTRARKAAGLKPSQLAARLSARGWTVASGDVARWERADTAQSPALVASIASGLEVGAETLMPHRPSQEPAWLADALSDSRIAQALLAWAQQDRTSPERVRRHLADNLDGAGYRKQQAPTTEALLAVIAVLRQLGTEGS